MAIGLFRIVSVGLSLGLIGYTACPVAYADLVVPSEFNTTTLSEYLSHVTPTRQCHYAHSHDSDTAILTSMTSLLKNTSELPLRSENHRVFPPIDLELTTLFTNIEKHYRALGYKLTSSLQISELKTVNAFAQDQRTVVITRALLARTHDTSEIAFVIAHEIAHIALNHDKNAGVHEELEADALALKVVTTMGFNPCSGSSVLERLGSRTKFILVSVSPRLTALHNKTFSICG